MSALMMIITFGLHAQSTTSVITCQPYMWSVTGETYTESIQVITASEDTLNLTVRENQQKVRRIFACNSYYWSETDQTYTGSGTYTSNELTADGCTIEHVLELTINSGYNSSPGAADCDTYTWQELDLPVGTWEARAVDLNAAGTILATGSGRAGDKGEVKVYQWSEAGWAQMGQTLEGINSMNFGESVSLSANGKHLAVGSPHTGTYGEVSTYEWNGNEWVQRGSIIPGIHHFDEFGFDIDLSNDGNILAASAPSSGRVELELGEVRVYQWVGDDWAQMGDHIYRNEFVNSANNNGHSLALSDDGLTVLFGAPFSKGFLHSLPGKVFKYSWDGSAWQIVQNLNGTGDQARYGWSVALSGDGSRIGIGSTGYNTSSGRVSWIGGTINGETTGLQMGKGVALNYDGDILALGSPGADDTNSSTGRVQIFKAEGGSYTQLGQDIFGGEASELFGTDLAMNQYGNIIAVASSKGSVTTGNPVNDVHVYYYGCTNTSQNCAVSSCTELITHTANVSECSNYYLDGSYLYQSGTYEAMLESPHGCDSLVTLNLTILGDRVDANVSACGSYEFDGTTYASSTTAYGFFTNVHGCDSIVALTLTIGTEESFNHERSACSSFEFDGNTLTTSGTYQALYPRASGCDSLAILDLTILDGDEVTIDKQACNSFEFDGNTYTSSGAYMATFTNTHGCDSLVTLNLEIVSEFDETLDVTACNSYEFDGSTLNSSGTYNASFLSVEGCDSLVTLNLEIVDKFDETIDISSCGSYDFAGSQLTASGTYDATFPSSIGCDSLVTLNLTILEAVSTNQIAEACGSYIFNDNELTASGNYVEVFMANNGCDSLVTLSLTILNSSICEPLAVEEDIESEIVVHPNPTTGEVYISGINDDESYLLTDITGKVLQKGRTLNKAIKLQSRAGVYIIVIPRLNKKIQVLKEH